MVSRSEHIWSSVLGVGGAFVHHCPFCPHFSAWNTEFPFVLCVEDACFIFIPSLDGFTRFTLMFLPGIPQEWGPNSIFTWEIVPHTDAKRHGFLLS